MGSIVSPLSADFSDRIPYDQPILPGCILTTFQLNLEDGSRIVRRNIGTLRQIYDPQAPSLKGHRLENLKTFITSL